VHHDGLTPLPDAPAVGLPVGFVVVAGTLIVLGGLLILVNLVVLVGGWSVRRVRGTSMEPALSPGRRVVVRRARLADVRPGAVVELAADRIVPGGARIIGGRRLIKRAVALPGDPVPAGSVRVGPRGLPAVVPAGQLVVLGDNHAQSLDSRHFGFVPAAAVRGIVVRGAAGVPVDPAGPTLDHGSELGDQLGTTRSA
jgi:signal peptidase I